MTNRHPYYSKPRKQVGGLSLLEVLVAMAIGVILLTSVTQLFMGSNQAFVARDQLAYMQENIRYISERFQRDIRMAGYQGCSPTVNNLLNDASAEFTTNPYIYDGTPVMGWEYDGSAQGDTVTLDALTEQTVDSWLNGAGFALPGVLDPTDPASVQAGSDVLMVKRSVRHNVQVNAINNGGPGAGNPPTITLGNSVPAIAQNMTVLLVDSGCSVADLFQRTNAANAATVNRAPALGNPPGNANPSTVNWSAGIAAGNASIYTLESDLYFIRNNGDQVPSLFRTRLGPAGVTQELISGVENMQVLYGISTAAPNDVVDAYVTAANVADFNNVRAVRIALLMRSVVEANDQNPPNIYQLAGTQVTPSDDQGDRFLRLVTTITVGLRNQLR